MFLPSTWDVGNSLGAEKGWGTEDTEPSHSVKTPRTVLTHSVISAQHSPRNSSYSSEWGGYSSERDRFKPRPATQLPFNEHSHMTCGLLSWLAGCHWQHQMFNETVSFVCLRKLNASNQTIRKPRNQHLNMLNAVLSIGNPRESWGTDPRSTQKRHGCKNEQNGVAVNGEQMFLGPSSSRETSTRFLWDHSELRNKQKPLQASSTSLILPD